MTLPAIDDIAAVGGIIHDYRQIPDPTVERTASQENQIAADAIMATRTLTRAFATFSASTTPALVSHDAVWGTGPGVAPVIAHTGTGVFTITWPATVTDALGVVQPMNLRRCWLGLEGANWAIYTATVTAPNQVTVRTWLAPGGPLSLDNLTSAYVLTVFAV
jgi:hypothetical protein